jgi:hypothetical protein
VHYPPYLNPPAEQTGEVANSACGKCTNSAGAPVDALPTLRINTQPAHPIELTNGRHNRARVPLRFGLTSRLQQRVDAPRQHLLPIEVGTFDVVMDLTPSPLHELVALCPGDPPHVCLAYTRHSVLLDPAWIIPARSSTRSAVSVAVAGAMANQPASREVVNKTACLEGENLIYRDILKV